MSLSGDGGTPLRGYWAGVRDNVPELTIRDTSVLGAEGAIAAQSGRCQGPLTGMRGIERSLPAPRNQLNRRNRAGGGLLPYELNTDDRD